MGVKDNLHGDTINIRVRIKIGEYDRLKEAYSKTTFRAFSNYLRALLVRKPIVGRYRNQSIDEFMPIALGLKSSLDSGVRTLGDFRKALEGLPSSAERGQVIDHLLAEEFSLRRNVEEIRNLLVKITKQ
jgi:hypothetical protein